MKKQLHESPYTLKVFQKGAGDPVVVLHGQLSTHGFMRDVVGGLAKHRHVYSLDLPGFGDSPRPRRAAYTIAQHVTSIHKTLHEAGVPTPFVLLGHSMGAQLALAYAKAYPKNIKGIVLTCLPLFESPHIAYAQMGASDPRVAWILQGTRARIARAVPRWAEPLIGLYSARLNKGVYPAYISKQAVRHNWQGYKRSMDNVVIGYEPFQDIKAIHAPLHFMFADQDTLNPGASKKLQPYLRKNHSVEVVAGSHQLPLEHTNLIVQRVLEV